MSSPDDQKPDQTNEARNDQRLRVDAGKVDVARLRLTAIDRAVFAGAPKHAADVHDRKLRHLVMGLFARG